MENSEDKHWASRYLLDPLNGPEPSAETGPGTHYNSTFAPQTQDRSSRSSHTEPQKTPSSSVRSSEPSSSQRLQKTPPSVSVRSTNPSSSQKPTPSVSNRSSNNPYRNATSTGYPSPPQSASPRRDRFSTSTYRQEAFPDFDGSYSPTSKRQSIDQASTQIPTSTGGQNSTTTDGHRRRRGSSLSQRFPGDQSHRPLDMIKQDAKMANRHPHLRKKHIVGSDTIDRMDTVGGFHHDGPYEATLLARNISSVNSPVEAVSTTNEEALRATPREMIRDSVEKHRPLDGVAMVPPGKEDRYGNVYDYEEGTDMMIENSPEGGAYKRWPGVQYLPEDLKGKGEPSYSLEKALKQHKLHSRHVSDGNNAIEMTTPATQRRPMSVEGQSRPVSDGQKYADWEQGVRRSSSGAGKLRRRFGSLRLRKDEN
ncbi:hypothetical protein HO173_008420 [Letharia columbiana]|uniref:Pal1 cell morphology n=1 Tax=Letharia columbiana TaxID=112416 RepID=A0A8H6L2W7_9LECA|nr:uncharacterized protein HO173_008420 [Letharia columbiana]KAF6233488.1 hypothetical protein HO173_008420 [Letharia columbiana]